MIEVAQANTALFTFADSDLVGLELGMGKDATAYDIGDGLVYRKSHSIPYIQSPRYRPLYEDHLEREITTYASLPEDVFVSRTLFGWIDDSRLHKVVEKGEGTALFPHLNLGESVYVSEQREPWEAAIVIAANISDEHYTKLLDDEKELRDRNIFMDYTGLGNLLYNPDRGFTIIDAEFEPEIPLRGKAMYVSLIGSEILQGLLRNNTSWEGHIASESREATITVLQRLESLGYHPKSLLKFGFAFNELCEKLDFVPSVA